MTDHFAALGLPRRAWLDPEGIKSRHHALIAAGHPDKPSGDAALAASLNAARSTLENPASRLRHLLELEAPGFTSQKKHEPDWAAFARLSDAARCAAELNNHAPSSPLARALHLDKTRKLAAELESLATLLAAKTAELESLTREAPPPSEDPAPAALLAEAWSFHLKSLATLKQSREQIRNSPPAGS